MPNSSPTYPLRGLRWGSSSDNDKKFNTGKSNDFTYLLGSKMKTIFEGVKDINENRVFVTKDKVKTSAEINALYLYLKNCEDFGYKSLIEKYKTVYNSFEDVHKAFNTIKERGITTNYYLEKDLTPIIQEMETESVLKFLVESFREVEDENGEIWESFQIETIFC